MGQLWYIDHVNSLCNYDLEDIEQQKKAFNWKNTRPLKNYDNLSKKYNTINDISEHNKTVNLFILRHHQTAETPI